jgi:hypothetical protein
VSWVLGDREPNPIGIGDWLPQRSNVSQSSVSSLIMCTSQSFAIFPGGNMRIEMQRCCRFETTIKNNGFSFSIQKEPRV